MKISEKAIKELIKLRSEKIKDPTKTLKIVTFPLWQGEGDFGIVIQERFDTDQKNKDKMFEMEGKKYDLSVQQFESKEEYQKELIRIKEAELAKKSESNTIKNYNKAKIMLDETNMTEEQKADILFILLALGGG